MAAALTGLSTGDGRLLSDQVWGRDADAVGALVSSLSARFTELEVSVADEGVEEGHVADGLRAAGLLPVAQLVQVERELDDLDALPPSVDVRLLDPTSADFAALFAACLVATPNRDLGSAEGLLSELHESAVHSGLGTGLWRVAVYDGAPVGVLLPVQDRASPNAGSIGFMGLRPQSRHKGLGRRLHATALRILAEAGATWYTDMTDLLNQPMRRVFSLNVCRECGRWTLYRRRA